MTKRELLELAAKAAGIEYREDRIEFDGEYGLPLKNLPDNYSNWGPAPSWNPIDRNDDTFRLAAALGLVVDFGVGDEKKIRLEITKQAAGCYCVNSPDRYLGSLTEGEYSQEKTTQEKLKNPWKPALY